MKLFVLLSEKKKYWITPLVIFSIFLSAVFLLLDDSFVAPFTYSLN